MSEVNINAEQSIRDILIEFLEVAIHNILYVRKVYPEGIFVRRKKYGLVVQQSTHPQLNEYIKECLRGIEHLLKENQVEKIVLIIQNEDRILERYIFDLLNMKQDVTNDPFFVGLEQSLRTFCLKLYTSTEYLSPVPDGCSFRVQTSTNDYGSCMLNEEPNLEHFPWIPVKRDDINVLDIIPLHTIQSDSIHLQMYIEKCS